MCNYKTESMQQVNSIDLKIVFSEDAKEWDKYLTECLTEAIESISYQLRIVHERIESLQAANFFQEELEQLKVSLSTLIIISPDFLSYVQSNDNLRAFFSQLKPDRTLCLLCGVKEIELTKKIKDNLVQYDKWKCLVAKDQDNEFIYNVIDTVCNLHCKEKFDEIYSPYSFITTTNKIKRSIPNHENEYKNLDSIKINDEPIDRTLKRIKPKFKLSPKRVKKGNNKVFILLDQPIDERFLAKVTLEFKTPSKSNQKCKQELREIDVRRKNAFTLQFLVTDDLLISSKVIRVNLFLEQNGQTNQLGVRLLKCETERALIENLSNCLPILKESLAVSTIDELDRELARRFKRKVPYNELNELLVERRNDLNEQKPIIEDLLTGDLEPNQGKRNQADSSEVNKAKSLKCKTKFTEFECPSLLHFAAEHNLKEFASSLLSFDASSDLCSIKNCDGLTPLSIAKLNGHDEISRLIKKYTHLEDDDRIDQDYVNLSASTGININKNTKNGIVKNVEVTSDFTSDGSDQSSIDGVDSVDGLILKSSRPIMKSQTMNEYDLIRNTRPIRLGKLIDLDTISITSDNSTYKVLPPPKLSKLTRPLVDLKTSESYEYDIVKTSPRKAEITFSKDKLRNSFDNNKLENCKTNLLDRFNDLRLSSSSSTASHDNDVLKTINLTEPQIELLNTAKAFKMGFYTNDELEMKFKEWAAKYHYKIENGNQFESDSLTRNRMGKRSVSSSHLLSHDMKLESKDSGCSSRSSTMKTCLSNINLNAASHSPSKFYQFSLTDWFHQLTAKLKKTDHHTHKSPKFEKKEKNASPSKAWTKRLSNVSNVRKSLFDGKELDRNTKSPKKNQMTIDVQVSNKIKSMTLPMRTPTSDKTSSPTAKLRNKLNSFKKLGSNAESPKLKMNEQLIGELNERSNDKFKLADKLSSKLNEKLNKQLNELISSDKINNNIINNSAHLVTSSLSPTSVNDERTAFRLNESDRLLLKQIQDQQNHVNKSFGYDIPPILAAERSRCQS